MHWCHIKVKCWSLAAVGQELLLPLAEPDDGDNGSAPDSPRLAPEEQDAPLGAARLDLARHCCVLLLLLLRCTRMLC